MGSCNSGGKGGSGGSAKGELVLPNGSKIEFEGELKYGSKDVTLTQGARKAIEAWEDKRVKMKVEYGYATDADGNPIGAEIRGSKGSVRMPYQYTQGEGNVWTHVHPRGDGILGGTFSEADMRVFASGKAQTARATAKEGTYSISKGTNFDSAGFRSHVSKAKTDFDKNYKTLRQAVERDYSSGKISYNDYKVGSAKAFNTALVKLHDTYLDGQKKYGYTYTLERRN